jgi:hypothetical protein
MLEEPFFAMRKEERNAIIKLNLMAEKKQMIRKKLVVRSMSLRNLKKKFVFKLFLRLLNPTTIQKKIFISNPIKI